MNLTCVKVEDKISYLIEHLANYYDTLSRKEMLILTMGTTSLTSTTSSLSFSFVINATSRDKLCTHTVSMTTYPNKENGN